MQALVKKYGKPGLWLEEVPVPKYGINDVLIKVHKASICGTDVHIWNWDAWAQKTIPVPMVIGHEFVGTVADIGSNVHDLEVGDILAMLDTGAYQEVSMSNFNAMPRPATVLVTGDRAAVIRRRETEEDVFSRDVMPEHLEKESVSTKKSASGA